MQIQLHILCHKGAIIFNFVGKLTQNHAFITIAAMNHTAKPTSIKPKRRPSVLAAN